MEKVFIKDVIGHEKEKALLSHAILQCCNDKVLASIKGEAGKESEEDARYIEVDLKMNGFTVSFSEFLEHLDNQVDRMIKEEARDIVLTKLNDVTNALSEIESEAERAIKKIVKDRLDVTIPEEEEW